MCEKTTDFVKMGATHHNGQPQQGHLNRSQLLYQMEDERMSGRDGRHPSMSKPRPLLLDVLVSVRFTNAKSLFGFSESVIPVLPELFSPMMVWRGGEAWERRI